MADFSTLVEPLRKCIHPVFFETGSEEFRYSTLGSCFLVGFPCGIFAVTLEHVVAGVSPGQIILLPQHREMRVTRFFRKIRIEVEPSDKLEKLVLLAVDGSSLNPDDNKNNPPVMDLQRVPNDWIQEPKKYNYMVFGYPNVSRDIDHEQNAISCKQHSFSGTFAGKSSVDGCLKLDLSKISGPTDVDGYSGSPVFAWPEGATDVCSANFCGVVVRGTYASGVVHFLARGVIEEAARVICS